MKLRLSITGLLFLATQFLLYAQTSKDFRLLSPDGFIELKVEAAGTMKWSVHHKGQVILAPSAIAMHLTNHETWGNDVKINSTKIEKVNTKFAALNYKKDSITDNYNQLTLNCKGDYAVFFRVYNDGVAYRFFTKRKGAMTVESEDANFNFERDYTAFIPYVNDPHNKDIYETSFESLYQHIKLSKFIKDTLAFAPVLVELPFNKKVVITEADLEDYPGMFLQSGKQTHSLAGRFAPYVLEDKQGGHNDLQAFVTKRADCIATTTGPRSFPWRIVVISENDRDLLNSDMIYKLASPSRLADPSWIKPGKVAWDWWNDWNISHVDFEAGINTATYKYYIDFAAANRIEYILLDEGWADSKNIMKIVPEINLQEIIDYGKLKNVGVWLWGGWLPLDQKTDEALSVYSRMGIKGFKVDFMDRDDQKMVQFYYRFAKKAAGYHLMIDYHGAYKPTGLQRTFPNVVNSEGVRGLENAKWSADDMPGYDVTIPFIRMLAGPMDYTPGAMRNASKSSFRPIYSTPMSQGTRCHQLAMYVIFEAPFEMLADTPTNYGREPESLNFISSLPTTFDETVSVGGTVGEYAIIARRKNETWYVGAMSNWDARDLTFDLSFLGPGRYEAEIFHDGLNADKEGTDYKREIRNVSSGDKWTIHLASGGGWVARLHKAK